MKNDDVIRSIICLFAMDGQISKEEIAFLKTLRKKLGVSQKVVKTAFEQAQSGKGKIYLSNEPEEMQEIFAVLVRAAVADGKVEPREREVLDAVAAKTGISAKKVEREIETRLRQALAAKPKPAGPDQPEPQSMNCPKCGFKQQARRTDCIRCGIIFARFTPAEPEPENETGDLPDVLGLPPKFWLRRDDEKERELQHEQQRMRERASSINKRLALAGSCAVFCLSLLVFWLGMAGELAHRKDSREKIHLATVSNSERDTVKTAQATLLSGDCAYISKGKYSHEYRCFVTYTFQASRADGRLETVNKKKEHVIQEWYNQQQLSQPVPIVYLNANPDVSRTMGRKYMDSYDRYIGFIYLIGGIVGIIAGISMIRRNRRKAFSPYEKPML